MRIFGQRQRNEPIPQADPRRPTRDLAVASDALGKRSEPPLPHSDLLYSTPPLFSDARSFKKNSIGSSPNNKRLFDSLRVNMSSNSTPRKEPKKPAGEGGQQLLDSLTGKVDSLFGLALPAHRNYPARTDRYDRPAFPHKFDLPREEIDVEEVSPPKNGVVRPKPTDPQKNEKEPSEVEVLSDSKEFQNHATSAVKGFAEATDQGIVRDYNEDRISVVLNLQKPERLAESKWPKCSFFAIYDGHGGSTCPEFLKEHLHQYLVNSEYFPEDPQMALFKAFEEAEKTFCAKAIAVPSDIDISGSCAIVALVVEEFCYIANLGDSRIIASYYGGTRTRALSTDMKPSLDSEQMRISKAGGKLYQTHFQAVDSLTKSAQIVYGPLRVLPGRLSVSRSFGDVEAKEPTLGGKPGVVIAIPEVSVINVNKDLDFLILASDGVFDKMENEEVIETCWKGLEKSVVRGTDTLEETLQAGVQEIMSTSLAKKTQDNISVVMVSFKSLPHLQKILQKTESAKQADKLRPVIKKQRSSSPQTSQPESMSQRAPGSESKSQQQASRCI